MTAADEELLAPYVPRLLLGWPEATRVRTIEGTMMSVDLSGFTALSERLAATGREGAEELTRLVNQCFEEMIAECASEGGDIITFGGDALLVFYDGDHHLHRACHSAAAMRRVLRRARHTHDGKRLRLSASTGIHTGQHTFHVPAPLTANGFRQLFVTGPGATATVDAESAAAAGQILLSRPTAALVPPTWLGNELAGGVVLRSVGSAARQRPPHSAPSSVVASRPPSQFLPADQREQIVAGAANEHRLVSVAFIRFAGTDALDVDVVNARLQAFTGSVWGVCEQFGVCWLDTDVYHEGGKITLAAGAPISRGADEDRLLRAVRGVIDADPGLSLRAGMNRGYVFAGDVGSATRRTYTTMGDVTNLAARLMAAAAPGQIVAARRLIDWASSNVDYEPLAPFTVKGVAEPVHAGLVGRVHGHRADLDRVDTELCGRVAELQTLLQRADAAAAGHGSVTVITGEPGIGKSRLALEVLRQRPTLSIVFARCQPYDRFTAYSVAQPLLRSVIGIDADAPADSAGAALGEWLRTTMPDRESYAPLIADAVGAEVAATAESDAVAPEFRQARTQQLVIEMLQRCVSSPTALVVDDLNQADDASRAIIDALREASREIPLFVVATSAPDETIDPHPMVVGALSEGDVGRLLDNLLGDRSLPLDAVRHIVARSAGNPLFVGELVRSLLDDPNAPIPDSLESLVSSRVDALDALDRKLLRQASVLGAEVDILLLGRVLGDALIRRQDRWERLGRFLEWAAPGVVRFRYDTYWRVVYGGLSYTARRAAHLRVVEVLEADVAKVGAPADQPDEATVALLAVHADRAADRVRTWRYALLAADAAARRSMFGEAAGMYRLALGAHSATAAGGTATAAGGAARRTDLAEVCERAGEAFAQASDFDEADRCLRIAARGSPEAERKARIARKRGEIAERQGRYDAAHRLYRNASRLLASAAWSDLLHDRAELDAAVSGLAYRQGHYEEAWTASCRGLTTATLIQDWRVASRCALIVNSVVSHVRWRSVQIESPDVLDLLRRSGDRVTEALYLNNQAVDLYYAGDWDHALTAYMESARLCAVVGNVVSEATAMNNVAEILSDQGKFGEAEQMFRRALRLWRSVRYPTGIALIYANLGRLHSRQGRYDEANGEFDEALERFHLLDARAFVDEVMVRRAENAHRWRGLSAGEIVELTAVVDHSSTDENVVGYGMRVLAAAHWEAGRREPAETRINRSVEVLRSAGIPFELAQSLELRAAMRAAGDPAGSAAADGDADEARRLYGRLGVEVSLALPLSRSATAASRG